MQEKYTIYMLFREISKLDFSRTFPLTQKYGIHPGQLPIFRILAKYESLSQGEIAKRLRITPASMTTTLNRLEAAGFIAKQKDATDKRRTVITLTKNGMKLNKDITAAVKEIEFSFTDGFSSEETEVLSSYLQRIKENLLRGSNPQNRLGVPPSHHCLPKNFNKEEGNC